MSPIAAPYPAHPGRPFGGRLQTGLNILGSAPDSVRMKAMGLLLAMVPVIAAGIVALLAAFLMTFPFENSGEPYPGSAVVGVVAAVFVTLLLPAAVCWISILLDQIRRARIAFAVHAASAFVLLAWALEESSHSDGTLLGSFLLVELCGLASVTVLSPRELPG